MSSAVQAVAPETTPAEVHPIVGAWILTVDEFPEDPPALIAFHAGGTLHESDADGATGIGAWEGTGPTSVDLTFVSRTPAEEGEQEPMVTIRATVEVGADGQTFTGEFTIEFTEGGGPAGQFGPGHVSATRINVEPMAPTASLEDLFAAFEGTEPAGTEPADTEPATTPPAGTEPTGTAPETTAPAGTEPMTPTTEPGGVPTTEAAAVTSAP